MDLVIHRPGMTTVLALVEDGLTFVCRTELGSVEPELVVTTNRARVLDSSSLSTSAGAISEFKIGSRTSRLVIWLNNVSGGSFTSRKY